MEEAQLEAEKGEAAFNEWLRASAEKARAGVPLLPPAAGAALLREQCVNTDPQRRLQGCASARRANGACCTIGTAGFRSSGHVLTYCVCV